MNFTANSKTTKFWCEGGEARDIVPVGYLCDFCFYEAAQDTAFTTHMPARASAAKYLCKGRVCNTKNQK